MAPWGALGGPRAVTKFPREPTMGPMVGNRVSEMAKKVSNVANMDAKCPSRGPQWDPKVIHFGPKAPKRNP